MTDSFLRNHPSNGPIGAGGGKGGGNPLSRFHGWQKNNPQFMPTVAAALNSLSTRPNAILQRHAAVAQQSHQQNRQLDKEGNRTADYIEQLGFPQEAALARQNPRMSRAILASVMQKGQQETHTPMLMEDYLRKAGVDPSRANPDVLNRVVSVGSLGNEAKVLGGSGQTINVGGDEIPPGWKKYSEAVGTSALEWQEKRPVFNSNIGKLEHSLQALIDGEARPGTLFGNMPEFLQKWHSADTSQAITLTRDALGGTLKETLGAQFGEKEGERIFNNIFDPRLSAEMNMQRISIALAQMKNVAAAKDEYLNYFMETQGDMRGFKPTIGTVTPDSIIEAMGGDVGGIGQGFGDGSLESPEELEELRRLEALEAQQAASLGTPPGGRRRRR